jgi:hypothetical protein
MKALLSRIRFSRILPAILGAGLMVTICADGLPGEYLVTLRWRDLMSVHSPLTNPAFITEENYISARGAISKILGDISLWEGGVRSPLAFTGQ